MFLQRMLQEKTACVSEHSIDKNFRFHDGLSVRELAVLRGESAVSSVMRFGKILEGYLAIFFGIAAHVVATPASAEWSGLARSIRTDHRLEQIRSNRLAVIRWTRSFTPRGSV